MHFNPSKCCNFRLSTKHQLLDLVDYNYNIHNIALQETNSYTTKYFGVHIDDKLSYVDTM